MLKIDNLSFSYSGCPILSNISFEAFPGETISILGANGVGKSTLFKCVLGILPDYNGIIYVDGKDTRRMSSRQLAQKIAYIPQMSSSTFNYSVEDIILMGTTARLGYFSSPGQKQQQLVNDAMERIGITHLRNRCFHHLSSGEKQLTIIARALAQNTNILLLDEPASSLDFGNQIHILETVRELSRDGYTIIQSTHDPEKAYMFSDKIIAMKKGRILKQGIPAEIMSDSVINELYGVNVAFSSLFNDKVRVFTPDFLIKKNQ